MASNQEAAGASRSSALLTDAMLFIALLSTALALSGAMAHLFELPAKLRLSRDAYFTVQRIYDGWWQFAYVLAVQAVSLLTLLALSRKRPGIARLVAGALLALIAAQAVFWLWTQPANVATGNWRTVPENWEALRQQWEWSHAAGALLQLVVLVAVVLATLASRRA